MKIPHPKYEGCLATRKGQIGNVPVVRRFSNLRLYYTRNDHYTINDAPFLQVETNCDFWSVAQYVNPLVELLQQLHKWTKKISYIY